MVSSLTALGMDLVASLLSDEPQVNVGSAYDEDRATPGAIYVAVVMLPGESDRLTSMPIYDVSVFSPKYTTSERVALKLDERLMGYPFRVDSGETVAVVDSVFVNSPPAEVDWRGDETIRRFLGTYQIVIRR